MPMGVKTSQVETEQIKHLIACGNSQTEVARQLGIARETVNRLVKANKKDIEQLALEIIHESIPLIKSNHISTLQHANNLLSKDPDSIDHKSTIATLQSSGIDPGKILDLSDKKEHRALQIMGIASASTPSIIINQLLNKGGMTVLNSKVAGFLADKVEDLTTIDAEYEEID